MSYRRLPNRPKQIPIDLTERRLKMILNAANWRSYKKMKSSIDDKQYKIDVLYTADVQDWLVSILIRCTSPSMPFRLECFFKETPKYAQIFPQLWATIYFDDPRLATYGKLVYA